MHSQAVTALLQPHNGLLVYNHSGCQVLFLLTAIKCVWESIVSAQLEENMIWIWVSLNKLLSTYRLLSD